MDKNVNCYHFKPRPTSTTDLWSQAHYQVRLALPGDHIACMKMKQAVNSVELLERANDRQLRLIDHLLRWVEMKEGRYVAKGETNVKDSIFVDARKLLLQAGR